MTKHAPFLRRIVPLAALLLLACLPVFAALTGDIQGTVLDPNGLAVSGARITVRNMATGTTRTAATSDDGLFSVQQLEIGSYEVRIEKDGFRAVLFPAVSVRSGETAPLRVSLEIGSLEQLLTVAASAPDLDASDAQSTDSFD